MQRRHDDPPDLAGTAGAVVVVQDFDEDIFRLDQVMVVFRAVQRDKTEFLRAVDINQPCVPRIGALLP